MLDHFKENLKSNIFIKLDLKTESKEQWISQLKEDERGPSMVGYFMEDNVQQVFKKCMEKAHCENYA